MIIISLNAYYDITLYFHLIFSSLESTYVGSYFYLGHALLIL